MTTSSNPIKSASQLDFSPAERAEFAEFSKELEANIGKSVKIPAGVLAALNRAMEPVDVALRERILAIRQQERLG